MELGRVFVVTGFIIGNLALVGWIAWQGAQAIYGLDNYIPPLASSHRDSQTHVVAVFYHLQTHPEVPHSSHKPATGATDVVQSPHDKGINCRFESQVGLLS